MPDLSSELYVLNVIASLVQNTILCSGDPKVQLAFSDPMTKPASSFTPRNSRADVSELQASGRQRPALQVSALSSLGAWPAGFTVARSGEAVPAGFAS
ncbi:UNVERIFIED_CONTAM: hypothetical protein FKN15_001980 [Acipenser sinensis]